MDEDLELHVAAALRNRRNLLERQLPCEHDALEPEVLHREDALEVVRDKLRRRMQLQPGEMLPADPRNANVLHDQRIRPHLVQSRQLLNRRLDVILVDDRIKGDVDLPTPLALTVPIAPTIPEQILEVLDPEVVRKRPRRELREPAVDGIRPRLKRGQRRLKVPGRS